MSEEQSLSCTHGDVCKDIVTCTPETCPYGQKGWRHSACCIKHVCAHDFQSGPWINYDNGGSTSCACGLTACSHDMRYAP